MVKVVVKTNAGLANRMRVLSSCIALQERLGKPIEVIWERNRELNCSFYDLFEPIPNIKIIDWSYLLPFQRLAKRRRRNRLEGYKLKADVRIDDLEVRELRRMGQDVLTLIQDANIVFISTCERFYGKKNEVKKLRPVAAVLKLLLKVNKPRKYLGVHIRQGDSELSVQYSPLEMFEERITLEMEEYPMRGIFLASDDNQVLKRFSKKFTDKLFYIPSSKNRKNSKAIQYALADLLLLSQSYKIIGSYWSSFSEEAAHYGEIELEVLRKKD